jgi:hypothetical protein
MIARVDGDRMVAYTQSFKVEIKVNDRYSRKAKIAVICLL